MKRRLDGEMERIADMQLFGTAITAFTIAASTAALVAPAFAQTCEC
ncbi:MAG: hypothetical protein JO288_19575, partial [Hyphomicrobiales bacterium]|nr:hypothetical protein [Hyphomicrobiales bacterium]